MTKKNEERIMAEIRSKNILDKKDFNALKDQAVKASKLDCQLELLSITEEVIKHFEERKKFMMKNFKELSKENQTSILKYLEEDKEKMKNFNQTFDIS